MRFLVIIVLQANAKNFNLLALELSSGSFKYPYNTMKNKKES